MKQEYFEVGQIVNTFGIKGFVKVKPFTDDMERFEELKSVLVVKNKEQIEMQIEQVKYQQTVVLLKFKGIEDINMAEKLKGSYLFSTKHSNSASFRIFRISNYQKIHTLLLI